MANEPENNTECCPEFDPAPWEDKVFEWKDRKFIKQSVPSVFYMPIGFGRVMRKLIARVGEAGAVIPDYLCLSDHTSRWNMDVYLAVDKEIPGAENVSMSGEFYSRTYEGPFRDTGKWAAEYEKASKAKGLSTGKMYMWYTTCPKCARKYGKNPVAIISQVN